jgi:hypothetical protein
MLSAKCDDRFASDFYAFAYALRRSFTTTSGLLLTASSFERGNRDVAFVVSVVLFFFFFFAKKPSTLQFCSVLVPEPEGTHYSAIGCLLLLQALKLCY